MAQLVMRALGMAGHEPYLASGLRTYLPDGDQRLDELQKLASEEIRQLIGRVGSGAVPRPKFWFTYHPYYKSPDLIGPQIARKFNIPYITAEASWAKRRARGKWTRAHKLNEEAIRNASLNLCFTGPDRAGLAEFLRHDKTIKEFPPFLDISQIPLREPPAEPSDGPVRLLSVAMMRKGVKLQSYKMLAAMLSGLRGLNWTLDIVGDGDARAEVEAAFSDIEQKRLNWHGQMAAPEIARVYGQADLLVWPGFGEAYGMVFLEAQAAGIPVIAQETKGIPDVVRHGQTGILTMENNLKAMRDATAGLICNPARRTELGQNASRFVRTERSIEQAARRLKQLLGALA